MRRCADPGTLASGLAGSTVGHTIIDLMSKNCWGLLGHYLRVLVRWVAAWAERTNVAWGAAQGTAGEACIEHFELT